MHLAFYRGKGTFSNKLIRWWTRSKISHVELVFDAEDKIKGLNRSLSFSSSSRDKGVRFKNISYDNKWEIVRIMPHPDLDEISKIFTWCSNETRKNRGYAFQDLFRFVLPFINTVKNKWFCSEICVAALQHIGYLKYFTAQNTDPQKLYEIVKSMEAIMDKK